MSLPAIASTDATKTTFLDLPNETIVDIFKYLNRTNGLKMCLNRRLVILYQMITYRIKKVEIEITPSFCLITINDDTENRFRRENFDEFAMELVRIAMNTAIDEVKIDIQSDTRDDHDRLFEAFFQLNAAKLNIYAYPFNQNLFGVPQLNLANVLLGADNIGAITVSYRIYCGSLSLEDLCIIYKKMAEDCKLEEFEIPNMDGLTDFVELRFGIKLEIIAGRSKIFRGVESSVNVYSFDRHMLDLAVCDGTIRTYIEESRISFSRTKSEPAALYKIKLNHRYDF